MLWWGRNDDEIDGAVTEIEGGERDVDGDQGKGQQ